MIKVPIKLFRPLVNQAPRYERVIRRTTMEGWYTDGYQAAFLGPDGDSVASIGAKPMDDTWTPATRIVMERPDLSVKHSAGEWAMSHCEYCDGTGTGKCSECDCRCDCECWHCGGTGKQNKLVAPPVIGRVVFASKGGMRVAVDPGYAPMLRWCDEVRCDGSMGPVCGFKDGVLVAVVMPMYDPEIARTP